MPKREHLFSVTLADCEVQSFASGGPGGQNQNTCNTGIRITHRPSGAVGVARDERSQLLNKRAAFRRMTEHALFKLWVNRQVWHHGESPEKQVEQQMQDKNLRVEVREDRQWKVVDDELA